MHLDILKAIKDKKHERPKCQTKEDQDLADQTFAAMRQEVNIIEAQMSYDSASPSDGASDGAQVYWDKDGVWEECRHSCGRRVPMDGGLSGMDENSDAWLSQHEDLSWAMNKGLSPKMNARAHIRGQ